MRLGDLDALKKCIAEVFETEEKIDKKWAMGLKYSLKLIDNAPTIIWCSENSDGLPLMDLRPRPQDEWISVYERLPQDRDWYLGVFKEPDTGYIIDLPFVCCYVGYPNDGTTIDAWILRGLTDIDNPSKYYKYLECVAWQPLPEPYKKETDNV